MQLDPDDKGCLNLLTCQDPTIKEWVRFKRTKILAKVSAKPLDSGLVECRSILCAQPAKEILGPPLPERIGPRDTRPPLEKMRVVGLNGCGMDGPFSTCEYHAWNFGFGYGGVSFAGDNRGRTYFGISFSVAKLPATFNYVDGHIKGGTDPEQFLSGLSVNANIGAIYGGGFTASIDRSTFPPKIADVGDEAGPSIPQAGFALTFELLEWKEDGTIVVFPGWH